MCCPVRYWEACEQQAAARGDNDDEASASAMVSELMASQDWIERSKQYGRAGLLVHGRDSERTGCAAKMGLLQWRGYTVWTEQPTTFGLMLRAGNFWAAIFFFLASARYETQRFRSGPHAFNARHGRRFTIECLEQVPRRSHRVQV